MDFLSNPFDFSGIAGAGMPSTPLVDPTTINFNLPATLAQRFSAAGISPGQFLNDPGSAASAVQPPVEAPSLGQSLTPLPTPDPRKAMGAADGAPPGGALGGLGDRLGKALQGVKAPEPPQAQKVGTPNPAAPRVTANIKSGELAAMLQALGASGAGLKLPDTLGAALSKGYRGY